MNIQLSCHDHILDNKKHQSHLILRISNTLKLYESLITKIDVQLSNEGKEIAGSDGVQCRVEARFKDRTCIDASNLASTTDLAAVGAIQKLNVSLETLLEKIHNSKNKQ